MISIEEKEKEEKEECKEEEEEEDGDRKMRRKRRRRRRRRWREVVNSVDIEPHVTIRYPHPVCHQELRTGQQCLEPLVWEEVMMVGGQWEEKEEEGKEGKGQEVELCQTVTSL